MLLDGLKLLVPRNLFVFKLGSVFCALYVILSCRKEFFAFIYDY